MPVYNRRAHIRHDLQERIKYIILHNSSDEVLEGITTNISGTGLQLYVFSPLTRGQEIVIKSGLQELNRKWVVNWCVELGDNVYKVGLMLDVIEEKRRYKRFSVDIGNIHGKIVFSRNVEILDISVGGVSLQADRKLNIGSEYTLSMGWKGRDVTIKGIVVWSEPTEKKECANDSITQIYKAAMKFTDIAAEKMQEIADFIEDHKKKTDKNKNTYQMSGYRLFARFQIEVPEKAILHIQYKVKTISYGGMLIGIEHALELNNKLPIEITLSEGESMKVLGRVTSCILIQNKEPVIYDVGIEFIEMSDKDKVTLWKLIKLIDAN